MIKCFGFYVNKALKYNTVIGNQSGGLMLSITKRFKSIKNSPSVSHCLFL